MFTPLYSKLKKYQDVKDVADILRMMWRWGLLDDSQLDKEIDHLQLKSFQLDSVK